MTILPKTLMLLGSGELGKEVAIAAKRIGCKVIACDKYKNAPAMQVADKSIVLDMGDEESLKNTIRSLSPDVVIPEIESLAVEALIKLEQEGINIIPNAKATAITMNRDKIRNLAAEKLGIKTAKYNYARSKQELEKAAENIKYPFLIKPVMSSSGKGQSLLKEPKDLGKAWDYAIKGARGNSNQVIIEEYIKFDFEITLLTIRQKNQETIFCPPIGHQQVNGDYQTSWQPQEINDSQLIEMQSIAKKITDHLEGSGLFGVEFFVRGKDIIFSELSPRPHDTGLVTLVSQNLSEFDLHIRAILGLPIPEIKNIYPSASKVLLSKTNSSIVQYKGIDKALEVKGTEILIFGKPSAHNGRRMGVILAKGEDIKEAKEKAENAAGFIEIK